MKPKIKKYTLMYQNDKVLTFSVDFNKTGWNMTILEKLEHFDKAPFGVTDLNDISNKRLYRFFNSKTIPVQRDGHDEILKATGCKSDLELAFKGHGLCLSNHYWFLREGENLRYEDINFFTNKWDDTFGRALLRKDYEALKHADLNVPDILTPGWGVKGWIYDNGPKLYKIGISSDKSEEAVGEVLASRLARFFFNEGEYLEYTLEKVGDQYASVSKPMIGVDEEFVPLSTALPHEIYNLYNEKKLDRLKQKDFFESLKKYKEVDLTGFFVRLSSFRTLAFVSDLHFDNLSLIRNLKTGKLRAAPLYDLGGAFGSSRTSRQFLLNLNQSSLLIIYYLFNDLDPDWDYSWYDPSKLEGFEDEIRKVLSKSEFYTKDILDNALVVYRQQKETLDNVARASKEKQNK